MPLSQQGYTEGANLPGMFPATQATVLFSAAAASGVPTPSTANLAFYDVLMVARPVTLVPANPVRTFLLLYNPTQANAQISKGLATLGAPGNLPIGPGEAYFWSTSQQLQPVYTGAITAIGQPGSILWAWEDNSGLTVTLLNDGGILQLAPGAFGLNYPTSPVGLPAGAVWNNGLAVSVIPGVTPNPSAPAVFFGSITAANLLAIGGGNLPTFRPNVDLQLWNNGGLISVDVAAPGGPAGPFAIGEGRIGVDFIG